MDPNVSNQFFRQVLTPAEAKLNLKTLKKHVWKYNKKTSFPYMFTILGTSRYTALAAAML